MHPADTHLAAIAERQYGLCTWEQALACGLTPRQVQLRVQSGRWIPVARCVYRVHGAPTSWRQAALAAVLAAPSGAVTSHFTAAALYGLGAPPDVPHLIVGPQQSRIGKLGVRHRSRVLPLDTSVVGIIPVTTAARTLVDCARVVQGDRLLGLVDSAFHEELATVGAVERALARSDGRAKAGCRALRAALDPWRSTIRAGSPAEIRLIRQVEAWGFPTPQRQIPVYEDGLVIAKIDLGWPEPRIGLEYDSGRFHGPERWAADEERHRRVVAHGWTLVHADKADIRPGERSLRDELRRLWVLATSAAA